MAYTEKYWKDVDFSMACEKIKEERDTLRRELEAARAEIERERMRLAACGVAALCNTEKSSKEQRIDGNSQYWSASYGDVCDAVDREIKLRADLAAAVKLIEKCKEAGESTNRRITTFLYEELCAFLKRKEVTL